MKSVRCARCGRTIGPAEMEEGLVIEARDGYYCGECVPYVHDKADWAADLAPRTLASSPRHTPRPPEMQMTEEPAAAASPPERPAPASRPVEPAEPEAPGGAPTSGAATSEQEDDPIILMQRILDELKPISRAVMYEKTSIWNTLGGVAQIFALAVILFVLTEWTGEPLELLLLAVFLQLATLTFFLKGK